MPRKRRAFSDDPFPAEKGSFVSEAERHEFLTAIAHPASAEADSSPTEPSAPQPRARRMKQLERGELRPAATLDLHGLSRREALPRTRLFLEEAARQRWQAVVIVTGKGLHSQEGPVLRLAVEQLLATIPHLVVEWAGAPRQFGGAGALIVFPRPQTPG